MTTRQCISSAATMMVNRNARIQHGLDLRLQALAKVRGQRLQRVLKAALELYADNATADEQAAVGELVAPFIANDDAAPASRAACPS